MGRLLSDVMAGIPPALAYLVVGLLATGESLFLGLVLPGELVLVLGGLLAFHGRASLTVMLVLAVVGSVGGYLIWGPGSVLIGYFAGGSYQKLSAVTGPAGLVLVMLLVLVGGATAAARWAAAHPERLRAAAGLVIDRPRVLVLRRRYRRELAFVARRFSRGGALGLSLTAGLVVIGLAGWVFGEVLENVLHRNELAIRDSPVAAWMVGHRTAWLTDVMQTVTTLGTLRVGIVLLALVWLLPAGRGSRWPTALMLTIVVGGTGVLVDAIKLSTTRTRPDIADLLTAAPGYAFPSGHSAQAVATFGLLAHLLAGRLPRWGQRVSVWTAAILLIVLVGFSRLYLGAHWLTDVLGGFALGAAWTALVVTTTAILIRETAGPEAVPARSPGR
jgi:undecaprenyl-diphosphatase